jgi:hypothetical protein
MPTLRRWERKSCSFSHLSYYHRGVLLQYKRQYFKVAIAPRDMWLSAWMNEWLDSVSHSSAFFPYCKEAIEDLKTKKCTFKYLNGFYLCNWGLKICAEGNLTLWAANPTSFQTSIRNWAPSRWHLNEDEDTHKSAAFGCLQTQFHKPLLYRTPSKIHFFIDQNKKKAFDWENLYGWSLKQKGNEWLMMMLSSSQSSDLASDFMPAHQHISIKFKCRWWEVFINECKLSHFKHININSISRSNTQTINNSWKFDFDALHCHESKIQITVSLFWSRIN